MSIKPIYQLPRNCDGENCDDASSRNRWRVMIQFEKGHLLADTFADKLCLYMHYFGLIHFHHWWKNWECIDALATHSSHHIFSHIFYVFWRQMSFRCNNLVALGLKKLNFYPIWSGENPTFILFEWFLTMKSKLLVKNSHIRQIYNIESF